MDGCAEQRRDDALAQFGSRPSLLLLRAFRVAPSWVDPEFVASWSMVTSLEISLARLQASVLSQPIASLQTALFPHAPPIPKLRTRNFADHGRPNIRFMYVNPPQSGGQPISIHTPSPGHLATSVSKAPLQCGFRTCSHASASIPFTDTRSSFLLPTPILALGRHLHAASRWRLGQ